MTQVALSSMQPPPIRSWSESSKEQFSRAPFNSTALSTSTSSVDSVRDDKSSPQIPAISPPKYEQATQPGTKVRGNWNPYWLRRSSLISFSVSLVLLAAGVLALLQLSNKQDGLKIATNNHYLWTYGPTALLILLTAIWRQIDFYCKALTPWAVLSSQEATASESILLDYLSPIQWTSFKKAYHNKHHAVVFSSIGFSILKLMALTSTGLLAPHTIHLRSSLNVTKATFRQSISESANVSAGLFEPAIAYEAFAVAAKSLPPPLGATKDFAYEIVETFQAGTRKANTSLSVVVRALIPTFQCQSAPFNIIFQPENATDINPADRVSFTFQDCTLRGNGDGTPLYVLNPKVSKVPPQQLSPLRQQIDCSGTSDNWQLLTLVDFRYNQTLSGNDAVATLGQTVQATSWSTGVTRATGVACKSSYTLENALLEYRSDTGSLTVQALGTQTGKLSNFSDPDLGALTNSAIFAASDMFGRKVDNFFALEYPDVMFKMMAQLVNGTYDDLFNETKLAAAAEAIYQQVAIQAMTTHLSGGGEQVVPALLLAGEKRLDVNQPSAIVIIIGGILVAMIAVLLGFIRPWNVICQNPELPSTAAAVLSRSQTLNEMTEQALAGRSKLKNALANGTYSSNLGGYASNSMLQIDAFQLLPEPDQRVSRLSDAQAYLDECWYNPMTVKGWFLFVSFFSLIALVGILEGLQRMSDRNAGIAKVAAPDSQLVALLPPLLSAFVMMVIATTFSCLEFNIITLAPFERLRNKYGSATGGLLTAYLGRVPPMMLCVAFLAQHWAVLLISSTALIGSLLTLVVSGLYTFDQHFPATVVSVRRLDQFDMNWNGSIVSDNGAAVVTSLTESAGLEYPTFTYRDFAFPALAAVPLGAPITSSEALLQVKLPAIRASLQCSTLHSDSFNFSASLNQFIKSAEASIAVKLPLPPQCQRGGSGGNLSFIEFDHSFQNRGNVSYVAKMLDLHVGPFDAVLAGGADEIDPNNQKDNPPECPTLAFIYGYADVQEPSKTVATILSCFQQIDQLTASATFVASNMSLSLAHPPILERSTETTITNPISYPYRIQSHFDNSFISNNQFKNPAHKCSFRDPSAHMSDNALSGTNPPIDPFFQGVLCGDPFLPISTFQQNDQNSSTKIFQSIQGMYRRYMAQAISSNMRRSLTESQISQQALDPLIPPATVQRSVQETRIVQQRTPKIILQCMLGTMLVLGLWAVYMSRLWEPIVPCNLCSIAGTMALFAGSEMCDPSSDVCKKLFPDRVQSMNEEELRKLWKGWEFRLGWWKGNKGRRWGIEAVWVG